MVNPRARTVVRGETFTDRQRARQSLGPLRQLLISTRMLSRYQKAVHLFHRYCNILEGGIYSSENDVDAQLCRFLDAAWNEGEPRSLAADAICGVQHALNRRRIFPGAWRLLGAWDRAELPNRTPPLPPLCALGLSGFLVSEGPPQPR